MKSSSDFSGRARQRKLLGPLLLGLLLIGIIAAIAIPFYLGFSSMMGGTSPQTAQQIAASTPGSQVHVAIEVTTVSSQVLLTGNLLQKNADGSYSRTGRTINVRWSATNLVMGSTSDVKVGAILQTSGVLDGSGVLTAGQIVVLTNVVKLK
jgi:hypothetical protein